MEPGDLHSRLCGLPGVLSCTVNDETVALLLHPEVDPRLLKARAQAVCAEIGESRPLIVVGGRSPGRAGAGAGVGAGVGVGVGAGAGAAGSGWRTGVAAFFARRATPVSIAVLSLFVLSAVVLAPSDSDRPTLLPQPQRSPSVALGPPPFAVPTEAATGTPDVIAPPAVPSFQVVGSPVSDGSSAVAAGPVLVGLPASAFAFGPGTAASPADLGPVVILETVGIAIPSPSPSPPATSAGPGPSAGSPPPPAPAPAAEPTQDASRTSSPLLAASSSTGETTKRSHGRGRAALHAAPVAPQGPQGSSGGHGSTGEHESVVRNSGTEADPEKAGTVKKPERGEGRATATAEKPERTHRGRGQSKPEQPSGPKKGEERGAGRSSERGR